MHVAMTLGSMKHWQWIPLGIVLALGSGCVSNHGFVRGAKLDVPALASELEALGEDEDALYDLTLIPFTHLDLQAFAQNDEMEDYPEGHAFISVRSWLPLFGIFDGGVELYDADHTAYETEAFRSILWGLWTRNRRTVQTLHGERTEHNYSLLWVLNSGPRVHYDPPAGD